MNVRQNVKSARSGYMTNYDDILVDGNNPLGHGIFGRVYLGRIKTLENTVANQTSNANNNLAIKIIQVNCMLSIGTAECIKEIEIMAELTNANADYVVKLCAFGVENATYKIAMTYAQNGTLKEWITGVDMVKQPYFDKIQQQHIMWNIAKGLEHIHKLNIVYVDMKPENILIDENMRALLCDFGLSFKQGVDNPDVAGTPCYYSPEILLAYDMAENTKESDIFAFSLVCWQIATQSSRVYPGINELKSLVDWVGVKGNRQEIPKSCPDKIARFITLGWAQKPENRPDAAKAVDMLKVEEIESGAQKSILSL